MIKCTTCVLGGYTPGFLRHEPIILPVRHWAVIHTEPKAASTSNRPGRCVLEVSKPQVCMQHVFPCQSSANHQASGSFIQPFHTQTKPQSINIETQQRESWSIQQQGRSMSVGSSISQQSSHAVGFWVQPSVNHQASEVVIHPSYTQTHFNRKQNTKFKHSKQYRNNRK